MNTRGTDKNYFSTSVSSSCCGAVDCGDHGEKS